MRGSDCQGFISDVRFGIPGDASYIYPDVAVVCGPLKFDTRDGAIWTVINPRLIVEVLSQATENVDRGRKFERCLQSESLQEHVLISQDKSRIQSFYRLPDGTWGAFAFVNGLESKLNLRSLKTEIPLSEIYLNVTCHRRRIFQRSHTLITAGPLFCFCRADDA